MPLESNCLYLQQRELIYKANVDTSTVGMPLESNCLYLQRRDGLGSNCLYLQGMGWFRKQLFVLPA